ncbi:MAG: DUF6178 family protein [Dissulfuribacterales bacterium]
MADNSNDIAQWQAHQKRLAALASNRKRILDLPADQALDEILDHPQPNALVHSFAEEDFYFLIHDIGPEDSLDLIAMASPRQWEYILDIESWKKDRININAVTRWMNLLLMSDPTRFIHWAATEKPDLIEYYLFKTIEIIIRDHDQDPSDFDDDFITYDDVFYFKLPADRSFETNDADIKKGQKLFLSKMMKKLADTDHVFFQQTLLRAANVIPAESEEEAFRLRNFRLAEKGFLPFDEAVGVYQPISIDLLKKRKKSIKIQSEPDMIVPVPIRHTAMLDEKNTFSRALATITFDETLHQLQIEFAGVCNRLIAADQTPVHDRNELKTIVKKACGYISIGLEHLSADNPTNVKKRLSEYIQTYPLIDLFRTGFGLVADLRQQAKKWQKNGWFSKNKLALSFWDEKIVGVIGGLLITRPKCYQNNQAGELYRDFECLTDIELAGSVLEEAMAFDSLLSAMTINTKNLPDEHFITHKNLLLTMWARHHLKMTPEPEPIPLNIFKPFYTDLWEPKDSEIIKESKKSDFLRWLAAESGLYEDKISQTLGEALEALFDEIVDEYKMITADKLDPRYVRLFMLVP